jgi:hypothetical protein
MRITKAYTANMEKLKAGEWDDLIRKMWKAKKYDFETMEAVTKAAKTAINKQAIYDRIVEVRAQMDKKAEKDA